MFADCIREQRGRSSRLAPAYVLLQAKVAAAGLGMKTSRDFSVASCTLVTKDWHGKQTKVAYVALGQATTEIGTGSLANNVEQLPITLCGLAQQPLQ
jgi:hypothetical protein